MTTSSQYWLIRLIDWNPEVYIIQPTPAKGVQCWWFFQPCIDDNRSQHNGMENWRFIEQIVKPMAWEYSQREKVEIEASKKENRPYKKPSYPEAGIWHKDSDVIEYPNHSARTLDQIKALI